MNQVELLLTPERCEATKEVAISIMEEMNIAQLDQVETCRRIASHVGLKNNNERVWVAMKITQAKYTAHLVQIQLRDGDQ